MRRKLSLEDIELPKDVLGELKVPLHTSSGEHSSSVRNDQISRFMELRQRRAEMSKAAERKREREKRRKPKIRHPPSRNQGEEANSSFVQQSEGGHDYLHQEAQVCKRDVDFTATVRQIAESESKFQRTEQGTRSLQGRLDKGIEAALKQRNFQEAWALNEKRCESRLASKVASAAAKAQHAALLKEEEEASGRKKRKKLQWGMEVMQKWEGKGNM